MIKDNFISGAVAEVVPVIGPDYYLTLNWLIQQAKHSLSLTIFTSSVNRGNSYHKIRKLLLNISGKIKKNDLETRAVLYRGTRDNGIGLRNEGFAREAVKLGLKIRLSPAGTFLHSKVVIVDRRLVLIGSHNFSSSSMSKDYEASILIESPQIADVYYRYFTTLWQKAREFK
jgi:phosphatidylserine/phosphatidylglycerophosphate/cardiolipin synthase-like enzyme